MSKWLSSFNTYETRRRVGRRERRVKPLRGSSAPLRPFG